MNKIVSVFFSPDHHAALQSAFENRHMPLTSPQQRHTCCSAACGFPHSQS